MAKHSGYQKGRDPWATFSKFCYNCQCVIHYEKLSINTFSGEFSYEFLCQQATCGCKHRRIVINNKLLSTCLAVHVTTWFMWLGAMKCYNWPSKQ